MRKLLLLLLLLLGTLGSYAQSSISVFSNNPSNTYVRGETLSVTYIITNNGTQPAYNVRAVYAVPTYLQMVPGIKKFWWTGDNGTSGFDNFGLDETTPVLAPNATKTYTINIKIPRDYEGPVSSLVVTYKKGADIDVVTTDNKTTYVAGTQSVYTVTVTNNGGDTATNVAVSVPIPAGITGFSWTGTNGSSGTNTAITNTIASLPAGQSVTYTVTVNVPATYTGTLTVAATATVPDFVDPAPTCTQCNDTDSAADPASSDVSVKITDNVDVYTTGANSTYIITVTNNGPAAATAVTVSNPVPAGVTTSTWVGSNSTSGTGDLNTVIPVLAAGQTITYTVTAAVPAGHTANIVSTVTVSSAGTDNDTTNNSATDTDSATAAADLVVTKTLNQGTTYTAGLNAIYTITVKNEGPGVAQNVSVTDNIPAGLNAASATWTGSNGSSGTGNLTNTIPSLAVGKTVTYTLTIPVPSNFSTTANIVNQVAVTSTTPDPDPTCPGCTHTATPNPLANIVTYKTNGQTTYTANSQVVYTIIVSNPGPSDAINVVVQDSKPYNVDLMTWEGNMNGSSGSLNNVIPVLAAGQSMVYTVTIYVKENHVAAVGPLVNTVTVTSSTPDPVPACLACTDTDMPSSAFVTVDKTAYSTEELVLDVLIDTDCINVYDITASAGDIYGNYGISYFNRNNASTDSFPIQEGVIIRNGNAKFSEGQYRDADLSSTASNAGDTDLSQFRVGGTGSLTDVSYLQFRFVPLSNEMSFDYMFAANEYGAFQCRYYDLFAFILTNETANSAPINIALIPTTNLPVSVGTIRNNAHNPGCASVNPLLFGRYNVDNVATSAINHRGQTVLLKAVANVVPNNIYKIKLAVGDFTDTLYDTAVFLAGGSFNIGQPTLPDDLTIGNGYALCNGDDYVINPNIAQGSNFIIRWEKDGVLLTDVDGDPIDTPTLTVSEPGIYTLKTAFPSTPDCFLTDDIKIEYRPDIESGLPSDLNQCGDPTQPMMFNLRQNDAAILAGVQNPNAVDLFYYKSLEELQTGYPPIYQMPYEGHDGETVIAVLMGANYNCYTVLPFTLHIYDCEIDMEPYTAHACDPEPYDGIENFDLTAYTDEMTVEDPVPAGYTYSFYNSQSDAQSADNPIADPSVYPGTNNEIVWVRTDNPSVPGITIFGVDQLTLLVTPVPAIADTQDVAACVSYTLPVLPANTNYYTATAAGGQMLPAGTQITTSQTLFTYVVGGTAPYTCTNEDSFEITIYTPPVVPEIADAQACDTYTLGTLLNGNYYTGPNGTGTMLAVGQVLTAAATTTTQTIYIYQDNGDGTVVCSDESSFELTLYPKPVVSDADPLETCDDNFDGFADFDLTQRDAQILNGQTGLTLTWHRTISDATQGLNAIPNPTVHNDDSDTVYASVIPTGSTIQCRSVVPLTLIVHPRPLNPLVGNLQLCDDNNSPDGIEEFDLTLNNAAAQGTDATLVVQYYRSQNDALTDTDAITNDTAFPNTTPNQQTIWVAVSNGFGCRSVGSFAVIVNPLPVLSTDPDDFIAYACEEVTGQADFDLNEIASTITEGATNYIVYFYKTEPQAQGGSTDFEPTPYLAGNSVIWARVINPSTGCVRIASVELRVIPAPIADQPSPIAVCDDNSDTIATFDLLPSMQAIEAALGNVTVIAFETQSDADLNVNAIPNPGAYRNIYPVTQTIYLRVQSTLTECYDTVTLVLIVNPRPAAATPAQAYALCDDGASDSDGQAIFNLNTQSAAILNGLDPVQYTIAYYRDAAATDLIATPGNFLSPTATVYAKVTNTATGCSYTVPVRLVVNGLPVLITNQYVYSLCDTQAPGDKETFDLTSVIGEFITPDNRNGVEVAFYKTLAAAQAGGSSPELIPYDAAQAYENEVPQVQSLYVRFTTGAGCYRIGFLDIRVEPKPVIEVPLAQELTVCATNNQGIGEFDLESLIAGMANGAANLDITFHLTETDAAQGLNAIPNPENYRNEYPYMQTIWVRVVNTISGCSNDPYEITLYVNPAPVTIPLANITLCDDKDNNGQNGSARFDITLYEADLIAAAAPTPVTITYYTTRENADAGTGGIVNPTTYTVTSGQVIWVRVEDGAGCYSITSFTITFNKPHLLINPTPLTICETVLPNDGIAVFVLTDKDDEILGAAGVGRNYRVEYFEQDPRVTTGAVAIATPGAYTNTTSPTTLYVRVTTPQGCVSYTTLTLRVLPLPVPNFAPTPLEVCDNDQSVTGSEVFNLTLAAEQIRNSGSNYVLTYYTSEQDAIDGVNAIPDPTQHNSASGTVYVKVTADTNNPADPGCYQIVALELIVNPLPPIADLADYGICNDSPTDPTPFNLKEYVETALGGNTNNEYAIEYYQDAALSIPAVPITAYVVSGRATVYIRVVDNATGCALVKELELIVEQQAVANPVTNPGVACDTDGANDGVITTWDLTPLGAQALGTQDPGVFVVSYYDIDPATVPAPAAITDPANYTNITADSQQIWIVVTNSDSVQDTPCQGVTTVTLTVERLPVPEPKDGTICVDIITEDVLRPYPIKSGLDATHTFVWEKDGQVIAGATGPDYTATEEGEYTVRATSANGCASLPVTVTVTKSGTAVVNPVNPRGYYVTNYFSDNQTITVDVVGYGKYEYILDEGTPQSSPVFTNVAPGSHTIRIVDTNANACAELVLTSVSVVDYPNFFTPNGDGFHDTWNIIGLQDTGSVIYIFDRYGKLIKQISPDSEGWDGTMNGHPVPATDYWFSVTYPEFDGTTTVTKEFKAHFSLKR